MSDRDGDDAITATLRSAHAGDRRALHTLIRDHLPWIEARVRQRLSPAVRAEGDTQDFVQEALLEVLRDGPKFEIDSTDGFRALMARIVENTLIDRQRYMHRQQRDRRRQQDLLSDSVVDLSAAGRSTASPASHAARSEQQAWLRLALELLDPEAREAIELRDWQELSFAEAGARLGITEEAMRKRYRRALPKLARKLEVLRRGAWRDVADDR